jgi:hypothetical protein
VGSWVDLTRWMYVARGGGGAGSSITKERHRVMIVESISWGAVSKRIGEPMAEAMAESEEM